jgi:hypothetical protein
MDPHPPLAQITSWKWAIRRVRLVYSQASKPSPVPVCEELFADGFEKERAPDTA